MDFRKHAISEWQTSEDKRMLKITEENGNETHHATQDESARNMECRNITQAKLDTEWKNVMGKKT